MNNYKKFCVEMIKQMEDSHSLNQTIINLNEELLKENRELIDNNEVLLEMLKLRVEKLEKNVPLPPIEHYGTGYYNPHQPWTTIVSDSTVKADDYTHV